MKSEDHSDFQNKNIATSVGIKTFHAFIYAYLQYQAIIIDSVFILQY